MTEKQTDFLDEEIGDAGVTAFTSTRKLQSIANHLNEQNKQLCEQLTRRTAQLHDAISILGWSKPEWQE